MVTNVLEEHVILKRAVCSSRTLITNYLTVDDHSTVTASLCGQFGAGITILHYVRKLFQYYVRFQVPTAMCMKFESSGMLCHVASLEWTDVSEVHTE
jgi:hypothetical protein